MRSGTKRLITVFEWPIPSFFGPVKQLAREGEALDLLDDCGGAARGAGGGSGEGAAATVTLSQPYAGLRSQPLLSDYTWNHTTLWAMKADPAYTYLQCGLSIRSACASSSRC